MYLELSRPAGDISRWEKVLKRLSLLNKNYPLTTLNCDEVEFQREMSDKKNEDAIYENVKNTFINQGVVFLEALLFLSILNICQGIYKDVYRK